MGGLRGGRGGGGGGGFDEERDSFEAMDDAKSLSDGCELFFGGGGGGGDESVGCCVVVGLASIFVVALALDLLRLIRSPRELRKNADSPRLSEGCKARRAARNFVAAAMGNQNELVGLVSCLSYPRKPCSPAARRTVVASVQ